MTCGFRVMLEREGHADEFRVVPGASKQLNVDRQMMIVEADRENDRRNTVGGARCVTTAETRSPATAVIDADFTQKSRIDDRVHTLTIRAGRVHPGFDHALP